VAVEAMLSTLRVSSSDMEARALDDPRGDDRIAWSFDN